MCHDQGLLTRYRDNNDVLRDVTLCNLIAWHYSETFMSDGFFNLYGDINSRIDTIHLRTSTDDDTWEPVWDDDLTPRFLKEPEAEFEPMNTEEPDLHPDPHLLDVVVHVTRQWDDESDPEYWTREEMIVEPDLEQ
jgi:hypothetical protein